MESRRIGMVGQEWPICWDCILDRTFVLRGVWGMFVWGGSEGLKIFNPYGLVRDRSHTFPKKSRGTWPCAPTHMHD